MVQSLPPKERAVQIAVSFLGMAVGAFLAALAIRIFLIPNFVFLAWRFIRRSFVIHMLFAILLFAFFLVVLQTAPSFAADSLEAIVIGGAMLGAGAGFIIRNGGCTDGTEILAIMINRRKGFTVGQVIFVINIFIFGAYGWIFSDWHIALRSMMTYIVAFKMMDIVIAGLEELKTRNLLSKDPMGETHLEAAFLEMELIHPWEAHQTRYFSGD